MEHEQHRRLLTVVLAGAIGIALVGFFVGTRPDDVPTPDYGGDAAVLEDGAAMAAIPYRELRKREHGDRRPTGDFNALRGALPKLTDAVERDPALKRASLEARRQRRAYDGAPPVVPHAISQMDADSCLVCHRTGMVVEDKVAPPISHQEYLNCTQCHTTTEAAFLAGEPPLTGDNSFVGLASRGDGSRAWGGAPPTMPHKLHMREDCASCHGVAGRPGLRTTHPERKNCRQCHAVSEDQLPWVAVWSQEWP